MATPDQWLRRLYAKLREQRKHAKRYDTYYSGESRLEIVTRDFRDVFGGLFDAVRMNLARVVVDATMERLIVDGFRVGTADDQTGAEEARRIWESNDLDEMSQIAHTEMGIKSSAYTLTWPGEDGLTDPVITIEDHEQVAVARRQTPPYDVIAALKVWTDEWTGTEFAELYLPDAVHRFRRVTPATGLWTPGEPNSWRRATFDNGTETLDNPYSPRIPVVQLANQARLLREPQSYLVDVAPLQDGHDKILADLFIAASFGAVPVRTATGLKFRTNSEGKPVDEHGNEIEPFDVRADRVWISPDAQSKFGTLDGASLEGFIKARDAILGGVRTIKRIPLHYFDMGGTSGVAGETLKALEGPLVRLVEGIETRVGSGWRNTMGFALHGGEFDGAPVRTRWADTETKAEATQADAAQKLKDAGVPLEVLLEKVLGWPRELITRTLRIREQENLEADELLRAIQQDRDGGLGGDVADLIEDEDEGAAEEAEGASVA